MTAAETTGDEVQARPRGRLVIKSLRLENFKSYGGVVNVGPFHKSFSSIVGPNGSGKSNVIDAMLFVFGKRAKQMRLSKISELIHNSETSKKVESASVTVLLQEIVDTGDGGEDYEVISGSELALTRVVYRNSQSKYLIDNTTATFTQVQKVLAAKGVDLENNRFLILQGEVEQISLMKPKAPNPHEDGLLEYLEDIVGTNQYIEMIETSAKQVEDANEERGLKLTRVRAAERERDALEPAKIEAEQYLSKELLLHEKKLIVYRYRKKEIVTKRKEVEDSIAALEKERAEDLEAKLKREKALSERTEVLKCREGEYNEALEAVQNFKSEFAVFERRDIEFREKLKHLKAKKKTLEASITKEEKKAEEAGHNADRYAEELDVLAGSEVGLRAELSEAEKLLQKEYDRVKNSTEHIRVQIEGKQQELIPFAAVRDEHTKALKIARTELEMLEQKMSAPANAMKEAQARLQGLKSREKELQTEVMHDLSQQISFAQKQKDHTTSELEESRSALARLNAELLTARKLREETTSDVAAANASCRAEEALLKASRNGTLAGVVGRLSELGTVDDRYDIAVGAAAGRSLKNIVVTRADDAQKCVEFLRQNDLGRVTFVILEKLEYLKRDMHAKQSHGGIRLFDLISVSSEANRVAFYYALRDTLVAENLEGASRLAYQPTRRNRVVTVGGQLIESSGAMTGGGGRPPRAQLGKKIGASHTAEDVARAERSVQEALGRANQAKSRVDELEKALEARLRECDDLSLQLSKVSLELQSVQKTITECAEQMPILRRNVQASENSEEMQNVKELQRTIARKESDLVKASKPCDELQKVIAQLEAQVLACGGKGLEAATLRKENANERLGEATSAISKLKAMIENCRSATKKAQLAADESSGQLKELKAVIEDKRDAFAAIEVDAERVSKQILEAEQVLAEKHDALQEVRDGIASLTKAVSAARSAELDRKHRIDDLTKALKEIDSNIDHWQQKIASIGKAIRDLKSSSEPDVESQPDADMDSGEESGIVSDTDGGKEIDDDDHDVSDDIDLRSVDYNRYKREIDELERELKQLKPNVGVIAEYKAKDAQYTAQMSDLDKVTQQRDSARKVHDDLKQKRHEEFMSGFRTIARKLKEMYQMITLGGDAELELVDSLDPFSEGIVFSVRPPKKSWKNIANLSGGEKTLSSLALVFALHHYKPTPLYFMDEIDAALDFKNVSIVANYVKERTKDAQFIIISLRNNMFELADRLVGIYKTANVTKSVTIDPRKFNVPNSSQPTQA